MLYRRRERNPIRGNARSLAQLGGLAVPSLAMNPVLLHVRTNLGLRPTGVEDLGATLLDLGLADRLRAAVVPRLQAPPFEDEIDADVGARNVAAVAALAIEQA